MLTRRKLIVAGSAVAVLVLVYFGISWYVVGQALGGDIVAVEEQPSDYGLAYEDISFSPRNEDLTLRGWWMPDDEPVATIIWLHGLDANRASNINLLSDLRSHDFSVLAFDFRGQGESDRVPLGAGYYETRDVHGAIDFLLREKQIEPGEIFLMGESFGAGVAVMAGVGEDAVVGVYEDSGFAALSDVMVSEVAARTPFPMWAARLLKPGLSITGRLFEGINVSAVQPEESALEYNYPIGITHCREDDRIPWDHARRIRANSRIGSWYTLFPGCGHAEAYDLYEERFVRNAVNYFREQLDLPLIDPFQDQAT